MPGINSHPTMSSYENSQFHLPNVEDSYNRGSKNLTTSLGGFSIDTYCLCNFTEELPTPELLKNVLISHPSFSTKYILSPPNSMGVSMEK